MENMKKKLSRYYWINQEVEKQTKRKERLQRKASEVVADSTKGSMVEFPYIERVVKLEGNQEHLVDTITKQIDESIEAGVKARAEVESIINKVDDPRERELLRARFIDCLSWNLVSERNYISKSRAREIVKECIKKIS